MKVSMAIMLDDSTELRASLVGGLWDVELIFHYSGGRTGSEWRSERLKPSRVRSRLVSSVGGQRADQAIRLLEAATVAALGDPEHAESLKRSRTKRWLKPIIGLNGEVIRPAMPVNPPDEDDDA